LPCTHARAATARWTSLTFIDFLEALGRVADAKSLPTASDLDAAGYPSILEWAIDKERLEGSAGSTAAAPAAAAATQAPAAAAASIDASAPTAAGEGAAAAAAAAAQVPAAAAPAPAFGNVPEIFRARQSARFGAPKPRPLYAKLELLLELVFRRLHYDPAQPDSAFSHEGLLRMVKRIDKELGP
jgi:hypothetical protein